MAILIKGMKMPDNCLECCLQDGEYGWCDVNNDIVTSPEERPKNCPLVEVSDNGQVREIGFAECANALLKMWIDNVVTDGEYNRIESKLYKYWTELGGHE